MKVTLGQTALGAKCDALAGLLAILTIVVCQAGCVDIKPTVARTECQERMRKLHVKIMEYVQRTGDLPRDQNGKFSVANIADPDGDVCYTAEGGKTRYIVNRELSVDDLNAGNVAVLCDAPESVHRSGGSKSLCAIVLFSSGRVVGICLDPEAYEAYEKWTQKMAVGNKSRDVDIDFAPDWQK